MKEFYISLKQFIQDKLPEFLHVDRWNEQIANLEDEIPFLRPALFIEFGSIAWTQVNKRSKKGEVPVIIHIVADCYGTEADDKDVMDALDLTDLVEGRLDGLKLPRASPFINTMTTPDHNHGNLILPVINYSTELTKCIFDGKNYIDTVVEPKINKHLSLK